MKAVMCLAVPGQIVVLLEAKPLFASAVVEFGGVRRQVCVACVPEAVEGDYVMVHAGIAISRVNAEEAARVLNALRELDLDEPVLGDIGSAEPGVKPR
jgi:hydrogenase expression/formation protein HypC